jgi:putative ABC transport system permease protein
MTHEVIVDPRTAERYDLSVNDTLYVGGTISAARGNEFTVVGISNTFSRFLAAPTVALHLSELQTVSGTAGEDRASVIAVSTTRDADADAVRARLARAYPEYEFRTNDEQVRAIIGDQAAVVASAATVSVLAVVIGVVLLVNVLALLVHHQRRQLAALRAAGVSGRSLVGVVVFQGAGIGLLGGLLAVAATPPLVDALNRLAEDLSGFADLAKTPTWLLCGALALAVAMGLVGAAVAGWRAVRLSPLEHLDR